MEGKNSSSINLSHSAIRIKLNSSLSSSHVITSSVSSYHATFGFAYFEAKLRTFTMYSLKVGLTISIICMIATFLPERSKLILAR